MIDFLYRKYMKLDKKKIFRILLICVVVYVAFKTFEIYVSADIFDAIGTPENFKNLVGNGKFLESQYRGNYYLDIKEPGSGISGTLNKYGNWFANGLFYGLTIISYMLIILFNLAFSTDISDLFKELMNTIMLELKTNIFDKYFTLIVAIAFIYIAISFIKNNIGQVFSKVGYIVLVIVVMGAVVKYSGDAVSKMTTMAKGIGADSIVSISSQETTDNNIGQISGELWGSLVHTPWIELEFDGRYNSLEDKENIVNSLFNMQKESEERQNYINQLNEKNAELFKENSGSGRIIPIILIALVNLVKMAVMIVIALIQVVFQLLTILFVLAFPFFLLLSIAPSFGGINLISNWWNQILGSQLGIVLTSFLLGLLIKIDTLISTYLGNLGTYGWFGITLFQTAIYLGVIIQRKQIFKMLMTFQAKVSSSGAGVWRGAMKTTDKAVDGAKNTGEFAADKVKGVTKVAVKGIKSGAINKANAFGDKVREFSSKHFDRDTIGERIRKYNKAKEEERRRAERSNEYTKDDREETAREKPRKTQNINKKEKSSYKDKGVRPNIRQDKKEDVKTNIRENIDKPEEKGNINKNNPNIKQRKNPEKKAENIIRPKINDLAKKNIEKNSKINLETLRRSEIKPLEAEEKKNSLPKVKSIEKEKLNKNRNELKIKDNNLRENIENKQRKITINQEKVDFKIKQEERAKIFKESLKHKK